MKKEIILDFDAIVNYLSKERKNYAKTYNEHVKNGTGFIQYALRVTNGGVEVFYKEVTNKEDAQALYETYKKFVKAFENDSKRYGSVSADFRWSFQLPMNKNQYYIWNEGNTQSDVYDIIGSYHSIQGEYINYRWLSLI